MHSLLHEAFSVALRWRGTAFFPEGQISQSFSHEAKCILCHSAVGVQTSSCQTLGAPWVDDENLHPRVTSSLDQPTQVHDAWPLRKADCVAPVLEGVVAICLLSVATTRPGLLQSLCLWPWRNEWGWASCSTQSLKPSPHGHRSRKKLGEAVVHARR